jgi:hypothetical protein
LLALFGEASMFGRCYAIANPRSSDLSRASGDGVLGLRKLGDVVAGVLERDELAAAGQVDRVVESLLPAFGHQANSSAPAWVNFT